MSTLNIRAAPRVFVLLVLLIIGVGIPLARATIHVDTVTANSIGHSFTPPTSPPLLVGPGFVTDYFIGTGAATLSPVSVNLDDDTQISFTLSAPAGQKFLIDVPAGAQAVFGVAVGWLTPSFDIIDTALDFSATFQDLGYTGPAGSFPTFTNSSAVGLNNQFFTFSSSSTKTLAGQTTFSAVTFTVSYSARSTGNGPLNYSPFNPSSLANPPQFAVGYETSSTTDPGSFVSIIPEPSIVALSTVGALLLLRRRRSRGLTGRSK